MTIKLLTEHHLAFLTLKGGCTGSSESTLACGEGLTGGTGCGCCLLWGSSFVACCCSCCMTCEDPEGGARVPDPPPPEKSQNIGFSSNTGPDPLKDSSYQASIQCWAIIGTSAKRHLMAFHRRADDGALILVLGSSLPSSSKKHVIKVGPPLTKLSGPAHV